MSLARDWNYGDESSIVLANAVHVSVLPRAWMHMFLVWLDKYSGLVGKEFVLFVLETFSFIFFHRLCLCWVLKIYFFRASISLRFLLTVLM